MELVGSEGILIYRPATWDEVFTYKCTYTTSHPHTQPGYRECEDFSGLNQATI